MAMMLRFTSKAHQFRRRPLHPTCSAFRAAPPWRHLRPPPPPPAPHDARTGLEPWNTASTVPVPEAGGRWTRSKAATGFRGTPDWDEGAARWCCLGSALLFWSVECIKNRKGNRRRDPVAAERNIFLLLIAGSVRSAFCHARLESANSPFVLCCYSRRVWHN